MVFTCSYLSHMTELECVCLMMLLQGSMCWMSTAGQINPDPFRLVMAVCLIMERRAKFAQMYNLDLPCLTAWNWWNPVPVSSDLLWILNCQYRSRFPSNSFHDFYSWFLGFLTGCCQTHCSDCASSVCWSNKCGTVCGETPLVKGAGTQQLDNHMPGLLGCLASHQFFVWTWAPRWALLN